jgi:hypothetical protein
MCPMHSDANIGPRLIKFPSDLFYGILDRLVEDSLVFGLLSDLLVDLGSMSILSV